MEKFNIKKQIGNVFRIGIPLAIGVGLFYWLYTNMDVNEVKNILRYNVNYFWIALMMVISMFSHIFRGYRWQLQLRALGINAPANALVASIFGTYAVNLIFPRLGEVWRCGYIAQREKAPFTKVVGSMVADRLSDSVTVLVLTFIALLLAGPAFDKFFATFPQVKESLWHIVTSPTVWTALIVAVVAIVLIFRFSKSNKIIMKIKGMVSNIWQGIYGITQMDGKWMFLLYTVLIWGCYFIQLYVCFFAFDFTSGLSIVAALVCFVLSSISMGIPTNGGLGAWHIAIIFGLSLYGVGQFSVENPDSQASAFAMLVWGSQTLLLIALGIYAFIFITFEKKRMNK